MPVEQTQSVHAAPCTVSVSPAPGVAARLVQASAIYGLSNFGTRALNFLLLPVYTHYLTPADYGAITLAETVAIFMLLVLGLGFDSAIQRLYFEHIGNPDQLASYVGSVLKFALAMELLAVALVLSVGPFVNWAVLFHSTIPLTYIVLAVITASTTQFFQYRLLLFQAEHRPKAYALLAFILFVITAAASLILVAGLHLGAPGMLEGKLAGSAAGFLLALFLLRQAIAHPFKRQYVLQSLKIGVPVVPHMLMAGGLIAGDRFILGHYRDLKEVGLYAVAYSFGMVMSLVTMSLQQAWSPMYYSLARKGERAADVLGRACSTLAVPLAAVACLGALAAEDFIRYFLNVRYLPAARMVPWIIAAYLAHSLFSLFSLSVMQAKRTHWLMVVSFTALLLNIGLDFVLIPRWGMYGAAWATAAAYPVEAVVMYFIAQRVFKLNYNLHKILAALSIFALALAVTQVSWAAPHRILALSITVVVCLGLLLRLGFTDVLLLLASRRAAA